MDFLDMVIFMYFYLHIFLLQIMKLVKVVSETSILF